LVISRRALVIGDWSLGISRYALVIRNWALVYRVLVDWGGSEWVTGGCGMNVEALPFNISLIFVKHCNVLFNKFIPT